MYYFVVVEIDPVMQFATLECWRLSQHRQSELTQKHDNCCEHYEINVLILHNCPEKNEFWKTTGDTNVIHKRSVFNFAAQG